MMYKQTFIIITLFLFFKLNAQNFIANASFSDVYKKEDSTQFYQISQSNSDVRNWIVPKYLEFDPGSKAGKYRLVRYFSSRDKKLIPTDGERHDEISIYGDQLFENNLGFIRLNNGPGDPPPLIQQKLLNEVQKGNYCLRFKYKYVSYRSTYDRPPSLNVVISPSDLKDYYTYDAMQVPKKYIKATLKDSAINTDENTPWQQKAYTIQLHGDEKFITVGCLRKLDRMPFGIFFVDDIELYKIKDSAEHCRASEIDKDLRVTYSKEFPLNTDLESDTMVMYFPSGNLGSYIISPEAKFYLNTIIAFMQRHPLVKIKFIEYDIWKDIKPAHYFYFKRYINFFGIANNRISVEGRLCKDPRPAYCGRSRIFIKIGFMFYE